MATKMKIKGGGTKKGAKLGKPKPAPRTRSRVESSEPKSTTANKSAQHRQTTPPQLAQALDMGQGEVLIIAQLSELVPVAQYANVTIGPIQLGWKLAGADMSVLADIDWDSDEPFTDEQQEVWDRVRGSLKSTSKLIEEAIAEDRDVVDASVRAHNAREK